jgi:hypothetical protein
VISTFDVAMLGSAAGGNEDECRTGRQLGVDRHGRGVDAVGGPGLLRHIAKRVAADAGDHPRVAASARRGNRLVGAFAARPILEALAEDGLTHQRQARRPERQVRHENPEHCDWCARHVKLLPNPVRRCSAPLLCDTCAMQPSTTGSSPRRRGPLFSLLASQTEVPTFAGMTPSMLL